MAAIDYYVSALEWRCVCLRQSPERWYVSDQDAEERVVDNGRKMPYAIGSRNHSASWQYKIIPGVVGLRCPALVSPKIAPPFDFLHVGYFYLYDLRTASSNAG